MAFVTGTATGYIDLQNRLVTFLTTNANLLAANENWTLHNTQTDSGEQTVFLSGPGTSASATGTLTLTANVSNNDTITIDSKVYTFLTTLTNTDGNVLIGATASDSIDNLIAAITLGTGVGTTYALSTTEHPTVLAFASTGDTMIAAAKVSGITGNGIATTETSSNAAWGAGTLSGGADGARVYINISTSSNDIVGYFNWSFHNALSYEAARDFSNQLGRPVDNNYLTLFDQSMRYWFIANGRRFIIIAQVSTIYACMYAGFYLPYGIPSEIPYPVYTAGNTDLLTNIWSQGNFGLGSFFDPGRSTISRTMSYLRQPGGAWVAVGNYNSASVSRATLFQNATWPYHYYHFLGTSRYPDRRVAQHPDGSYCLLPIILHGNEFGSNVWGELDGAFYATGNGPVTVEDTITINSINYLIIQSSYRNGDNDYAAVRLS